MASSPSPPPMIPLPTPSHINLNDNANHSDNDNDNDDAQSDISVPYSSLTESITSDFLTPTSSDTQTVAGAEGADINLQSINTVLHEIDISSDHQHDEQLDNSIAQWRSLYHDDIQRQIESNRNRDRNLDRERSNTATMSLSAGNLRLHTSQTSTTLRNEEGGGSRLNGSGQTTRRKGAGSNSSSSSTSSSYMNPPMTTNSASASCASNITPSDVDDQNEFPPLNILSPAPTVTHSHTRSSTPTPAYESAPSSPSGAQDSKPRSPPPPPPPSRYARHAFPVPGQTFILLEASTGRALTLIDGNLRLAYVPDPELMSVSDQQLHPNPSAAGSTAPQCVTTKGQCNWHWHCVETSGWLGFRNAASGTFLGHDMWQNIIARVYRHQGWEWMTVRPAPISTSSMEGKRLGFGWYLMVTHWEKLYKINFLEARGGAFVATDSSEGTVWEFVRV